MYIVVDQQQTLVNVCLDTGAEVSLIPECLANRANIYNRHAYTGRKVQAANGQDIQIKAVASFILLTETDQIIKVKNAIVVENELVHSDTILL